MPQALQTLAFHGNFCAQHGSRGGSEAEKAAQSVRVGGAVTRPGLWLLFAIVMAGVGLVFAIPGPDEPADFKCCGVCIDLGVFNICNKRRAGADDAT